MCTIGDKVKFEYKTWGVGDKPYSIEGIIEAEPKVFTDYGYGDNGYWVRIPPMSVDDVDRDTLADINNKGEGLFWVSKDQLSII